MARIDLSHDPLGLDDGVLGYLCLQHSRSAATSSWESISSAPQTPTALESIGLFRRNR